MKEDKVLLEELRAHFHMVAETLKLLTIRSIDVTLEIGTDRKTVTFPSVKFIETTVTASRQITEEL
jgi:predicted RNase H-related nuclease YkuK (DUF458 family)